MYKVFIYSLALVNLSNFAMEQTPSTTASVHQTTSFESKPTSNTSEEPPSPTIASIKHTNPQWDPALAFEGLPENDELPFHHLFDIWKKTHPGSRLGMVLSDQLVTMVRDNTLPHGYGYAHNAAKGSLLKDGITEKITPKWVRVSNPAAMPQQDTTNTYKPGPLHVIKYQNKI